MLFALFFTKKARHKKLSAVRKKAKISCVPLRRRNAPIDLWSVSPAFATIVFSFSIHLFAA
jgi:hypothetical protein